MRRAPGGAAGAGEAGDQARPALVRPRPRRRDPIGFALRTSGELLLTLGAIVLLFAVYEVWGTNLVAHREQSKVHHVLQQEWNQGTDLLSLPADKLTAHSGDGVANLYIPRLGTDYAWTIVEGSTVPTDSQLTKGPVHYGATQLPGQAGNFAIAGHRVGKGEPFLNLDKLKPGDPVIVETATTWYVYCVVGTVSPTSRCDPNLRGGSLHRGDSNGVRGQEVVSPTNGGVLLPVPNKADATAPYRTAYLTMTTCTPKFTATDRLIVHAALDPTYPSGIAKQRTTAGYSAAIPAQIKDLYQLVTGEKV
jgi:sortase A